MNLPQSKLKKYLSFENNTLVYLIFFSVLIFIILYNKFVFGNFVFFFRDVGSDSINITLPNYIESTNLLKKDGFFNFWSFYGGMGQQTANPITLNPFILINSVLLTIFGYQLSFYRIFLYFFYYILPSGIVAYFLFKTLSISKYSSFIGALLFEFSGYMIIGSQWGHAHKIFYFIFLIFSFEQLLIKRRWWLLPIAFYFLSSNTFLMLTDSIFLLTYSFIRFYETRSKKLVEYIKFMFLIAGLALIGIAANAPRFLTNLLIMLQSPRVLGNAGLSSNLLADPEQLDSKLRLISTALRLFANDLLGTGSNFSGWKNYLEAPLFYIGLLPLIVLSLFFRKKHKKVLHFAFLGLWIFIALVPFARHAVNLFMGDYYKNTIDIFVPFVILFYGIFALDKFFIENSIKANQIFIPAIITLALLNFPYKIFVDSIEINFTLQMIVSTFIIAYTAILIFWNKIVKFRRILLLILIISELIIVSYSGINNREIYSAQDFKTNMGGYNDETLKALKFIKKDTSLFYRIEKDYKSSDNQYGSLNDSKAQNYFGTKSYSSFNQLSYIDFLESVGVIKKGSETGSRWSKGTTGNEILMTFASVKYFIVKNPKKYKSYTAFKKIYTSEEIAILKNKCFLPFGFCYDKYISETNFIKLSNKTKQKILLEAIVLDSSITNGLEKFNDTTKLDTASICFETKKLKTDTLEITSFKNKKIKGTINLKTDKVMFFSIPYDKGWTVKVNKKRLKPFRANIGFMAIYLPKGNYNITLRYLPPYFYLTLIISILSISLFVFLLLKKKIIL